MIMGILNCQKNSNKSIQLNNLFKFLDRKFSSILGYSDKDFFKLSIKVLMDKSSVDGG